MLELISTIRLTPSENLGIAKFVIEQRLISGSINYSEFLELEQLIKLYEN